MTTCWKVRGGFVSRIFVVVVIELRSWCNVEVLNLLMLTLHARCFENGFRCWPGRLVLKVDDVGVVE